MNDVIRNPIKQRYLSRRQSGRKYQLAVGKAGTVGKRHAFCRSIDAADFGAQMEPNAKFFPARGWKQEGVRGQFRGSQDVLGKGRPFVWQFALQPDHIDGAE